MDIQPVYYLRSRRADVPRNYYLYARPSFEHVPRPPLYRPSVECFPGILYFTRTGQHGVLVEDILNMTAEIKGANDPVLEHHGWKSTVVNLEWPGFMLTSTNNPMHARIDTHRNGCPLTRLEFAQEVCSMLYYFHKCYSRHPLAPGWERWSMNPDTQGIHVSDLVLLSVHYYRNIWVPELYVRYRG